MNPLFQMMGGMGNGYGIGDVIRLYRQAKQNPSMLGNLLYQNGRIDQNQLQAMNGMNPQQMGQYLGQNGIMPQKFLQNGNQFTSPVRQSMNEQNSN